MNYQEILTTIEQLARDAGAILKKHFEQPRQHMLKGDVDLVTDADREAEDLILNALKEQFPDDGIVGEEGGSYNPGKGARDYYWYIDPLDGTTNFAHRFPHFCVSIALTGIDRTPILGVVYDPIRDECFKAYAGGGATLNNQPIQVSDVEPLANALVVTGFPYDRRTSPDNNVKEARDMIVRAQGFRRTGSAALDLCYLAAGRVDGYWEQKLHLWDCLAGIVIVQEAGGTVTDYRGKMDLVYQKRPQVLATNGRIHQEMQGVLR
jgi:myo-inositol-1(or 4)-monophosphatase